MKILGKVLDVTERLHKEKSVADVVLKSGEDVIQFTLWNNEFSAGTHMKFKKLIGQDIRTDVQSEVFNGRLQYKFGHSGEVVPLAPAGAVSRVS